MNQDYHLVEDFYSRLFEVVRLQDALQMVQDGAIEEQFQVPRYGYNDLMPFVEWVDGARNLLENEWNLPNQQKLESNPFIYVGRFLRAVSLNHQRSGKHERRLMSLSLDLLKGKNYNSIQLEVVKVKPMQFLGGSNKVVTHKRQQIHSQWVEQHKSAFFGGNIIAFESNDELQSKDDHTFIYGLFDPSLKVRKVVYVGQSINPRSRLKQHILSPGTIGKLNWLSKMVVRGVYPKMLILDEVPLSKAMEYERRYIYVAHTLNATPLFPKHKTLLNKQLTTFSPLAM